jgi:alpha-tubulin suppressor-like RCC1 family protein
LSRCEPRKRPWFGELGDGTNERRLKPVAVAGNVAFRQVGAGNGHNCGMDIHNLAYCWGRNIHGQPVPVSGNLRVTTMNAGGGHNCAVTLNGRGFCWGSGGLGELGNGGTSNSAIPVPVAD